jgi:NADH dehydrogenase
MHSGEAIDTAVKVAGVVGGVVVGAIIAKKLLNMVTDDQKDQKSQSQLQRG